jgi:hypothetical protein
MKFSKYKYQCDLFCSHLKNPKKKKKKKNQNSDQNVCKQSAIFDLKFQSQVIL